MADEKKAPDAQPHKPKQPGIMAVVKAIVIVVVLVVIQIAAASVFIPGPEETTETARRMTTDESEAKAEEEAEEEQENGGETVFHSTMREVDLGSFHVLTYDPVTGSSLNVDFDLFGTVLAEDESEFYELYAANTQRVREQVLIAVRGMEVTDFTDAGLGLIKRKILEKTNRALGKPLVHEAIFSKFSFIER